MRVRIRKKRCSISLFFLRMYSCLCALSISKCPNNIPTHTHINISFPLDGKATLCYFCLYTPFCWTSEHFSSRKKKFYFLDVRQNEFLFHFLFRPVSVCVCAFQQFNNFFFFFVHLCSNERMCVFKY